MLGEVGIALLSDDIASPLDDGSLTPTSVILEPLADRFRSIGFEISVTDTTPSISK